jgi:DNA-binding NarL/FixJ family response regulator
MQNIDASALAAAKAKLDAAEAQREEVLLRHIANGVDIRSRSVEIDPEVVAIVSTGYDNDDVIQRYLNLGFSGYVTKPYRVTDLAKSLKDVLGERPVE